jgi:hypothetical protein
MKAWLACVVLGVLPAGAQAPAPSMTVPAAGTLAPCGDCGVVRSVNRKEKQSRPATDEGKPSGLVATVPLGGGKVRVGPSQKLGREAVITEKSWDVVVQLDDGKFKLVTLDRAPDLQQGDRVRVEGSQLVRLAAPAAPLVPDLPPAARK